MGNWFPCRCKLCVWIGHHGVTAFHMVKMAVLCSDLKLPFPMGIPYELNYVPRFLCRALYMQIVFFVHI